MFEGKITIFDIQNLNIGKNEKIKDRTTYYKFL